MRISVLLPAVFLLATASALVPQNPGDLNADNAVTVADVYIVSGCLGQNAATCQGGKADPNTDGAVNIFDFIHVSSNWGRTYGGADLTPPVPTITSPTMNQVLPAGTTQVDLAVTTDEPARCKHHNTDVPYASMSNTFNGGALLTSFSNTLTNLQDGQVKDKYIRCQDVLNNTMQGSVHVQFSIGSAPGATCGNGVIEGGEQCEGSNLNGATCQSRGFTGGALSCSPTTCQYVTSACTNPPPPIGTNEPPGLTPIIDIDFGATRLPTTWTSSPSSTYGLNSGKAHVAGGQVVPSPAGYAHRQTFSLTARTGRGVGADIFAKEDLAGNSDGNSVHSYRIWYERGTFYFGGKNGEQTFENMGADGFKLFGYWGGMCPGNMQATQLILWAAPPQSQRNTGLATPVTDWEGQIRWNSGCSPTNTQPWSNNQNHGPTFTAGTWHTYEVLLDAGDIDQPNGKVTLWVDGVQIVSKTQIHRTSTAQRGWYGRLWDPVLNGAASADNTKQQVDILDVDKMYVAVGQQID